MLAAELGLDEDKDVFEIATMLGMRDLMEIAALDLPELHDPPHHPLTAPALAGRAQHLPHHPRDRLDPAAPPVRVVRHLGRALPARGEPGPEGARHQDDAVPDLERTPIIGYLVDAARNGKQVAVVVELKARFDEAANIQWATRLEEAGIHVTYGVVGLKTHSKVILVVRHDYDGLRRYAHIGTGNYHAGTARLYTDLGLFTCDDAIGHDLTELFNYLTTGYKPRATTASSWPRRAR